MPIKVTLGEVDYQVSKMNIGQIEDLQALDASSPRWSFQALAIMMKRSSPKVADVRELEAELPQIQSAIKAVMTQSGYYRPSDPNPPAPDQPGQGATAAPAQGQAEG